MSDDGFLPEETGFDPSQAADSMASGVTDFFGSAVEAAGDVGMAALDAATGVGGATLGFVDHIEAGVLRAVGADETANEMDAFANSASQDGDRYFGDARQDLGNAWDAIAGED